MTFRTSFFVRILPAAMVGAGLGLSGAAHAQFSDDLSFDLGDAEATSLEGSWALQIRDTVIFRFDIVKEGSKWSGTWLRPDSFASDGNAFARIKGPVESVPSMAGLNFAGMVELSFDDPRPGAIPDIFRFKQIDASHAELSYVGTDLEPYNLVRVSADSDIGDWNDAAVYRRPVADEGLGKIEVLSNEQLEAQAQAQSQAESEAKPAPKIAVEVLDEPEPDMEPEEEKPPRIQADFLDGI